MALQCTEANSALPVSCRHNTDSRYRSEYLDPCARCTVGAVIGPQTEARHPARRVDVLTFNVSGWQELQAIASVSLWGGCSQLLFCVS